jgi:hypothetical protein
MNKFPTTFEVTVRFGREGRLRMWIASQLIKLTGWVLSGVAGDVDYGSLEVQSKPVQIDCSGVSLGIDFE